MARADGSVIIDTLVDTSGFGKDMTNMKVQFDGMAKNAHRVTVSINRAMDSVDVGKAAEGMSDAFSQESIEIQKILNDVERSQKSKAASIAAIYRKQGLSQSEALQKAWQQIERTSKSGSKKVQKHIGDIGEKSKSVGKSISENLSSGLASAIKKIGLLIASAFAVRSIINFGKQAIELGSDLQEVQNVVDVTFTTMSDKVDEFAKNAATTAGLSETMAKKYVGLYGAMSKSFGFVESDALVMSTSLAQLAGDVSSFYNIAQDEAYTKLKSVFSGETETLKDLGVVMTQNALDSFAMAKGYNKTTDAMSEQEKVALRYQFVMEQLSGASGDFLRTSDSWANQVRVLKLNVESFMATVGQGLINLLTPVIKVLNRFFTLLNSVAGRFKEWTESITGKSDSVSSGMSTAANEAANIASSMEDTATAAKKVQSNLSGLDEISVWSSGADSTSDTLNSVISSLGSTATDDIFNTEDITENIEDAFLDLSPEKLGEAISNGLIFAFNGIGDMIETIDWAGLGKRFAKFIKSIDWKEVINSILKTASSALKGIGLALAEGIKELWDGKGGIKDYLDDLDNDPFTGEETSSWLEKIKNIFDNIAIDLHDAGLIVGGISPSLEAMGIKLVEDFHALYKKGKIDAVTYFHYLEIFAEPYLKEAKEAAKAFDLNQLDAILKELRFKIGGRFSDFGLADLLAEIGIASDEYFKYYDTNIKNAKKETEELTEEQKAAAELMQKSWEEAIAKQNASAEELAGIVKEKGTDAGEGFVTNLGIAFERKSSDLGSKVVAVIKDAESSTETAGNTLGTSAGKAFLKGLSAEAGTGATETGKTSGNFFTKAFSASVSKIGGIISDTINKEKTEVESAGKTIGETIAAGLSGSLATLVTQIIEGMVEALKSIKIGGGGGSGATSLLPISWRESFSLPLLAKGTVIPPNAPFAAILGDQKQGTNIEAPLDTIKQAVREVNGEGGGGGNSYNITAVAKGKAIFELILSEARQQQTQTGKNPFLLK